MGRVGPIAKMVVLHHGAKATDNLGALTTSSLVNISVANSTATAVTLINPVWNGSGFGFFPVGGVS